MKINVYIDAANLYKAVQELGWELDYKRFRIWLNDKYDVQLAYLFIGLVPGNKDLYTRLQEDGYTLVFKEVTYDGTGKVKGNCDAELVLRTVIDYYEKQFDKAVIVSSDGDYACLVNFLKNRNVLFSLVSPSSKCSYLLRKLNIPIVYLGTQRKKIEKLNNIEEKTPSGDETLPGSFS